MERSLLISLVVILLNTFLESVIGSVVGPSLIFYIESVGGTKEDYGLITSVFFVGMTLLTTFFGRWVDSNGNKYQAPFAVTFILGIVGSIIYFLASVMPVGRWAVYVILVGRFITGAGIAGKCLLQSWIATAIPQEQLSTVFTIFSMVASFGQFVGPPLNRLVAEIDTSVAITSSFSIPINPYNSIGLLVAFNEALVWALFALFLKDPPSRKEEPLSTSNAGPAPQAGLKDILKALTHFDIAFPLVQNFVIMFNFTLFGVALAPVAETMLGWTPVQISNLAVVEAVVGIAGMAAMLCLTLRKTTDFTFIFIGNAIFVASGVLTYLWWRLDTATIVKFSLPLLLVNFGYPFSNPANQSSFTKAVSSRPETADSIGVLQGLYTQAFTIAGIVAPPFVTAFVMRDRKDIDLNSPYELTPWALYVPVTAFILIVGLLYEEFVLGKNELGFLPSKPEAASAEDEVSPDETSKLVKDKRNKSTRRSIVEVNQVFSRKYEVDRRMSAEVPINGVGIINPFETAYERKLKRELTRDKKEWEHLLKLDEEMDEMEKE